MYGLRKRTREVMMDKPGDARTAVQNRNSLRSSIAPDTRSPRQGLARRSVRTETVSLAFYVFACWDYLKSGKFDNESL